MKVMCWWSAKSADRKKSALICDGAIRSGKTLCMSLSFICWALTCFNDCSFAICGKTIRSVRRNILNDLIPQLKEMGFSVNHKLSESLLEVSGLGRKHRFYIFGGKDEGSGSLIQGMTLAGVLFDEVALMPRSFVEQAMARCSVEGSKLWFNCNPENPQHWFYREWIERCEQRNALYLHFTMDDNPSLSRATKERYRKLFSGTFYKRFVEGKWVAAQGLVYPFATELVCDAGPNAVFDEYVVSCDYGTACHRILEEPTDAYECSFVAVPAQKNAGVTKKASIVRTESIAESEADIIKAIKSSESIMISKEQSGYLAQYIEKLERNSQWGEIYQNSLKDSIIKYSAITQPDMPQEIVKSAIAGLDTSELVSMEASYRKMARRLVPLSPQLAVKRDENENTENDEFKI